MPANMQVKLLRVLQERSFERVGGTDAVKVDVRIDLETPLTEQVRQAVAQIESQYIRTALTQTHGHVGKSARICGLSRRCMTAKIAKFQLDRLEFNDG